MFLSFFRSKCFKFLSCCVYFCFPTLPPPYLVRKACSETITVKTNLSGILKEKKYINRFSENFSARIMGDLEDVEQVEVIVGTYEEFVLGYKLVVDPENEKHSLSISFTNHSQSRSIRAVSTIGKYVAAGSADESINLINLDARVEHGSLQEQNGTITCLTSYNGNYLFSGCDDGTICIWKKGSWLCEKTLKAHIGGVTDVSVHPSGKLALSIGKDKALKTWNLVKGRCGYVTNLKAVGDAVKWSPEGGYYAVSLCNRVDVYSLQSAKVVYSTEVGKRISCISFIDESVMLIAGDKESVEVHNIQQTKKLTEFNCHKNRVKAMQYVPELKMIFTASNDGLIKVWKFKKEKYTKPPALLTEFDTTCRVTCMTIWVKEKEELDEKEEEEVEDEEEVEAEEELGSDEVDDDEEEDDDDDEEEDEEDSESEEEVPILKKRRKVEMEKPKKTKKTSPPTPTPAKPESPKGKLGKKKGALTPPAPPPKSGKSKKLKV